MNFNSVKKIEWIVLSIVLSCFAMYITVHVRASKIYNLEAYILKHRPFIKLYNPNILMDNANNGDLLFFCGDTRGERVCRWCTSSMFSHVAILFREIHPETQENVVYVWEADVGHKSKRGPRVMRLEDKLKYYHGSKYTFWRALSVNDVERPTTESILNVVEKYKHLEFDDSMMSYYFSNTVLFNPMKNRTTVFCSELVAMTLQDLGVLNTVHRPVYYSPGTFSLTVPGLTKGYAYGSGTYIHYDGS